MNYSDKKLSISVIIPTFKRPIQLIEAVKSCLNQSFKDFEIIVVDDDTEDVSNRELLASLNDNRVIYTKNLRNKGGNGARNTGLYMSKAEYVCFLDDDDVWYPTKLAQQFSKMEGLHQGWAGCYCGWETDGKQFLDGLEGTLLDAFLKHEHKFGASSTLFFRRESINSVGGWDEDLPRYQDYELMCRIYKVFKFGYVNEVLLNINGHNDPNFIKIKAANDVYLRKMVTVLDGVDEKVVRQFYRYHYRSLAVFASLNGSIKDLDKYLRLSFQNGILPIYSYMNIVVYFLNYYSLRLRFGRFKLYMDSIFSSPNK